MALTKSVIIVCVVILLGFGESFNFNKLHNLLTAKSFTTFATILGVCSIFGADIVIADEPVITAKVSLDFKIAGSDTSSSKVVTIGVFGEEAPLASQVFLSVCKGENPWDDISYDLSQVSRILKNERIDVGKFAKGGGQRHETWMDNVGKVRIKSVNVAENTINNEQNNLHHDFPGAVSMKRGGGSFQFTIAPLANQDIDQEEIVIGRVLSGMDVVDEINSTPTSREDILGTKAAFSNAGKSFDGRAKLAMPVGKPLRKIVIRSCTLDDKASLSSFMKF